GLGQKASPHNGQRWGSQLAESLCAQKTLRAQVRVHLLLRREFDGGEKHSNERRWDGHGLCWRRPILDRQSNSGASCEVPANLESASEVGMILFLEYPYLRYG